MTAAKKYISLLTLSLSYAATYSIVYLQYVFYNPMLDAFAVSFSQFGLLMTMYALTCMVLYIPGGYMADKFSTRKILALSLAAHGILCIVLSLSLNYTTALFVWLLFGFTSAFAFWAALVKGMLSLSTKENSGRVTSIYALGCAIFSILINLGLMEISKMFADSASGLRVIAGVSGGGALLCTLLVFFIYRDNEKAPEDKNEKFEKKFIKPLLKLPILWILALVIFTVYGVRIGGNTFFNPYLADTKGFDQSLISFLGIIRSNVLPMLAPIAGYLADKVFKSVGKLLAASFALLIMMFLFLIIMPASLPAWLIIAASLIPGALSGMTYGIVFSVLREARIPDFLMGTVIGIISILGFLPDLFFGPVLGSMLDRFGTAGFPIIFASLIGVSFAGIAACLYVVRYSKKVDSGKLRPLSEISI